MKVKRIKFETNHYVPGGKSWSDLRIDYVKKYGVMWLWDNWRIETGNYIDRYKY